MRREPVLCVAFLCAALSALFVPLDAAYASYIDARVLILLFCLMATVAGCKASGLFDMLAKLLLQGDRSFRVVSFTLVMLPFFASMLVTNDVALIAFVPFAVLVLTHAGRTRSLAWVVVLQAVAANLGGMATPVGNPQNLYLFLRYDVVLAEFLGLLAPYVALAFAALAAASLASGSGRARVVVPLAAKGVDVRRVALHGALFAARCTRGAYGPKRLGGIDCGEPGYQQRPGRSVAFGVYRRLAKPAVRRGHRRAGNAGRVVGQPYRAEDILAFRRGWHRALPCYVCRGECSISGVAAWLVGMHAMMLGQNDEGKLGMDRAKIEQGVRLILEGMGEDPDREGLLKTPERVAKMYEEVFSGLTEDPSEHFETTFDEHHEEMILVRDIPFYSMCEHHLVPFFGLAHVAYIPAADGRICGLSKLARLVDVFAKRPQVQERLTSQIADTLIEELHPQGVIVVLEAEHMCMSMRGVKKPGTKTMTSAVRGAFEKSQATRAEALSLIFAR